MTVSPPSQKRPSSPVGLVFLILVGIAAVLVGGYFLRQGANPQPNGAGPTATAKKLTREQSQKLVHLRDEANANLENLQLKLADDLLQEIIQLLPDDSFGHRNLVICRELALEKAHAPDREQGLVASAKDALDRLIQREPNDYVTHVLASRLAILENDDQRAATALRRASELAPQSAPVFYDLYSLIPPIPGERPTDEAVASLRKVYELQPDNLFVLKDWLITQVQIKAPDLPETVAHIQEILKPFVGVIQQHQGINIEKMGNDLAAAVTAGNWPLVSRTAMPLRNVIAPEALRDERFVKLNVLEYMKHDFGPDFYQQADLLPPASGRGIPVKFTVAPQDQQPKLQPAVKDLVATDFDMNGEVDGAALYADHIVVVFPLRPKTGDSASPAITVGFEGNYHGLVAIDLDDDKDAALERGGNVQKRSHIADPDLILYGPSGIKLFENRKTKVTDNREFVERPIDEAIKSLHDVIALTPGDLDLDGDLDFLTLSSDGIRLWSNRGNWTFEEITSRSQVPPADFSPSSAVAVDFDRDTDLDVVIAGATGVGWLENLHHGRFRWRDLDGDFASLKHSRSLIVEELDGNASWDLIGAGPNGLNAVLTRTSAASLVSAINPNQLSSTPSVNVASLDLDNDGQRDLLLRSDNGVKAWRGLGNGTFEVFALELLKPSEPASAIVIVDVDQDGDEDLVVARETTCEWVSNEGGNANGWINVALIAEQLRPGEQNYSKRVNHVGIGSSIELRTGERFQDQVVKGPVTHFGLGSNRNADLGRVLWTNGIPGNLIGLGRNVNVFEDQKLLGSCPYLYVWDGEKFAFYTDLLWNAPLGLKFAENVVAPWREWEYLKIDGDKLRAKDGEYPLRVTAELWEIEYFDQIKLYAVDHPVGTQIFTNEKVGPPDMADHKIHTVRTPRVPVAARDPKGRDILDQVIARDGVYTKTFEHKLAQGLTVDHFLELDLGDWSTDQSSSETSGTVPLGQTTNSSTGTQPRITLFLTGWMFPASTSLNVQFSQNPDGPKPHPPSLHAVGADGQWREVRPFMGFPGGKTKTIAIDISDVFPPGSTDHRLRIATNMEFYWEAAFYTVDEEPVPVHETELPLVRAELHDRGGVSLRHWPESGNGPDQFDYQTLIHGDSWPPIEGTFTRYGNVFPLLTDRDDHLVVMHPGDEIQLAFAVPSAPLPEGWVRDFVIYNVGWDKDCDLNTVYGETVAPMPFREMTVYGQTRLDDAEYVRYLKTFQTRTRPRAPYWNQLRLAAP